LFILLLVGGAVTSPQTSDILFLRRYGEMLFLWVAAAVIALFPHRVLAQLLAGALIGFVSEIVGVRYGIPYGAYQYTPTLGASVAGVPLAMIAAWFVLLSYAWHRASELTRSLWTARLLAALVMVAFDLLIDPVAIGPMKLWVWQESGPYYGVPSVNFLGWFAVSFVSLLFVHRPLPSDYRAAHLVGVAVLMFFVVLALRNGLLAAASVGAMLIGGDVLSSWRRWRQYFATAVERVGLLLPLR
jgi:putative membrane protein